MLEKYLIANSSRSATYQGPRNAVALGAMFLIFSVYYARVGRAGPVILAHMDFDAYAIAFSMRA